MTTVGILWAMPAGHWLTGSPTCTKVMMPMPALHLHQFAHAHPAPAHYLLRMPTDCPRTGASAVCSGMPVPYRFVMPVAKKEEIMSSSFKRFPWKHGGVSRSMGIN